MGRKKKEVVVDFQDVTMFEVEGIAHLRVQLPVEGILWFMFAGGVRYVQVTDPAALDVIIEEFEYLHLEKVAEAPPEDGEGEDLVSDEDEGKELIDDGGEKEEED